MVFQSSLTLAMPIPSLYKSPRFLLKLFAFYIPIGGVNNVSTFHWSSHSSTFIVSWYLIRPFDSSYSYDWFFFSRLTGYRLSHMSLVFISFHSQTCILARICCSDFIHIIFNGPFFFSIESGTFLELQWLLIFYESSCSHKLLRLLHKEVIFRIDYGSHNLQSLFLEH